MDTKEIKDAALQMRDIKDLRRLLNAVKRDALGEIYFPFHLKQITYYCNPRRENVKRYINFYIPKKNGELRVISAPVAGLKSILTYLNTILQAAYEPSKYAMGFVQGRSVVENAKAHMGQNYVFNLDLKDFFPSIEKSRIWKRLTLPPFNFSSKLADVIAGLCTMLDVTSGHPRYILPQGAPTSPILTNIVCEKLDRQLGGLAKRFGLQYTRYADDITFSSMHYVYSIEGEFISELHKIIAANHFSINEKKTRLQKVGNRQEVTGLVLSSKINVARKYTREIRTLLHIWEKHGYMAACMSYMHARMAERRYRRKGGMPNLDAVLMGKLQYLKMVKGIEDSTYRALNDRFSKLRIAAVKAMRYLDDGQDKITYLQTTSRNDFEQKHSTKLEYAPNTEPNLFFKRGDIVYPISISKKIDVAKLFGADDKRKELWNKLQISLCDNGTTLFFLLHKKLTAPQFTQDSTAHIEQLQVELENLVLCDFVQHLLKDEGNDESTSFELTNE